MDDYDKLQRKKDITKLCLTQTYIFLNISYICLGKVYKTIYELDMQGLFEVAQPPSTTLCESSHSGHCPPLCSFPNTLCCLSGLQTIVQDASSLVTFPPLLPHPSPLPLTGSLPLTLPEETCLSWEPGSGAPCLGLHRTCPVTLQGFPPLRTLLTTT